MCDFSRLWRKPRVTLSLKHSKCVSHVQEQAAIRAPNLIRTQGLQCQLLQDEDNPFKGIISVLANGGPFIGSQGLGVFFYSTRIEG